jgi:adenylate kinase family enzyme
LFDGFPRTIEQAKALDSFLSSKNIEITATIGLEADEILIQRIIERGKTSQRPEDKDEIKSENDLKSIMIKPHHSLIIILNKVSSILLMESELLRMLHKSIRY